jgi:hypothetical protein
MFPYTWVAVVGGGAHPEAEIVMPASHDTMRSTP